jgi:hypothetical protein
MSHPGRKMMDGGQGANGLPGWMPAFRLAARRDGLLTDPHLVVTEARP